MTKKIFAALLLLSSFSFHLSPLSAENVVRLESATGTASEYGVSELLRVELMGDSIRFIAADGTVAAEVYKYDYVQLTIADTETTGVEQTCQTKDNRQKTKVERLCVFSSLAELRSRMQQVLGTCCPSFVSRRTTWL